MPLDSKQKKRAIQLLERAAFQHDRILDDYFTAGPLRVLFSPDLDFAQNQQALKILTKYQEMLESALREVDELCGLVETDDKKNNSVKKVLALLGENKKVIHEKLDKARKLQEAFKGLSLASKREFETRCSWIDNRHYFFDFGLMDELDLLQAELLPALEITFQKEEWADSGEPHEAAWELYQKQVMPGWKTLWQDKVEQRNKKISAPVSLVIQILKDNKLWRGDESELLGGKPQGQHAQAIFDCFIDTDSLSGKCTPKVQIKADYLGEASQPLLRNKVFQEILARISASKKEIADKKERMKQIRRDYLKAAAQEALKLADSRLNAVEIPLASAAMGSDLQGYYKKVLVDRLAENLTEDDQKIFKDLAGLFIDSLRKADEPRSEDDLGLARAIYQLVFEQAAEKDSKLAKRPENIDPNCQSSEEYVRKAVELKKWCDNKEVISRLHYVKTEDQSDSFYEAFVVRMVVRAMSGGLLIRKNEVQILERLFIGLQEAQNCFQDATFADEKTGQQVYEKIVDAKQLREILKKQPSWKKDLKTIMRSMVVEYLKSQANKLESPPKEAELTPLQKAYQDRFAGKKVAAVCRDLVVPGYSADAVVIAALKEMFDDPKCFDLRSETAYRDPNSNEQPKASNLLAYVPAKLGGPYAALISKKEFDEFEKYLPGQLTLADSLDQACSFTPPAIVSQPLVVSNNSAGVFSNRDLAQLRQTLSISNVPLLDLGRHGEGQTSQMKLYYPDLELTVKLIENKTPASEAEKYALKAECSAVAANDDELEKQYRCLAHAFSEALENSDELKSSDVPYRIYMGHSADPVLVKKVLQYLIDEGFNAVVCGDVVQRKPAPDNSGGPARIRLQASA